MLGFLPCKTAKSRVHTGDFSKCYMRCRNKCPPFPVCCGSWTGQWKRRPPLRTRALPGPSGSTDNTIKSLESILGSNDSLDEGDKELTNNSNGPLPKRRGVQAAARRVRPLYVYVIYYCFIVVYLAAAWLQATEGDLASSTLIDGLVNDHLAVASGQVPRLATAGFVCAGPLELFMQLVTLLTVGAEAEALLGYSLFWAVYWLANLAGGLADAALSELPVTFGPANAAAGIVGALVAYYARNWALEERLEEARRRVRRRRQRVLDGLGGGEGGGGGETDEERQENEEVAKEEERRGGKGPARESLKESEAEVEVLPLLSLKFSAQLTAQARGLLNVLVALVVAGQGLLEFGGASTSASWFGLISAFWTGLVLTYGAGPQYEVRYGGRASAVQGGGGGGGGGGNSTSEDSAANRNGGGGGASQAPALGDSDGLTVVDVCPLPRRQLVLGGFVAGLGALICGWLAWMGTDV